MVAGPTPDLSLACLKSSIRLALMSESFDFAKARFNATTQDVYALRVLGC